jgi:hypothetical protein
MEFLERLGKVPDQIVEGLARRLTPGAEENQGELAEQQRKLLGVAKNPKAPLVARVEAASEASVQPAIAVEEMVVDRGRDARARQSRGCASCSG